MGHEFFVTGYPQNRSCRGDKNFTLNVRVSSRNISSRRRISPIWTVHVGAHVSIAVRRRGSAFYYGHDASIIENSKLWLRRRRRRCCAREFHDSGWKSGASKLPRVYLRSWHTRLPPYSYSCTDKDANNINLLMRCFYAT